MMCSRTLLVRAGRGVSHHVWPSTAMALLVLASGSSRVKAQDFRDGFEGNAVDPFWRVSQQSASAAPSTERPHSGQQSLKLTSMNTGQNKGVQLDHILPEPIYGRLSIWVYDTGADEPSSNYLGIWLANGGGYAYAIGVWDHDLGGGDESSYYNFTVDNTGYNSFIDRTKAWHHWEIQSCPGASVVRIDDQVVYTSPDAIPFEAVAFDMHAPSWRPAWFAYYDDFVLESCFDCDTIQRLKVKCKRGKLSASIKSSLPEGATVTLDNDGDQRVITIDARGKGKARWPGQSGVHTVSVVECPDQSREANCG